MATDGAVNRLNGIAYPASDERLLDAPLLMPGPASAPFSAFGGRRVNGAGLTASVSGSPEAWTVTAGAGVIYDSGYASQGAWRFHIPNNITGIMPARPSTGQSRIDLLVARIYDTDVSVGSTREIKVERIGGTAGASPTPPAVPDLSLLLATLTVPATGSITVTPTTTRVVAAGGILPVATTSERDALVTAGVAYAGLAVFNTQAGRIETYNGSEWDYPGRWQTYTPTLTTWPSNSTVTARYARVGKMVTVRFGITAGAGAFATGNLLISPPTTMADPLTGQTYREGIGSAILYDNSAGATSRRSATLMYGNPNAVAFVVDSITATATASNLIPWTWAGGDTAAGTFTYEEA